MRKNGIVHDFPTYNTMTGVSCSEIQIQVNFVDRLLDEMILIASFLILRLTIPFLKFFYHCPQGGGGINNFLWL